MSKKIGFAKASREDILLELLVEGQLKVAIRPTIEAIQAKMDSDEEVVEVLAAIVKGNRYKAYEYMVEVVHGKHRFKGGWQGIDWKEKKDLMEHGFGHFPRLEAKKITEPLPKSALRTAIQTKLLNEDAFLVQGAPELFEYVVSPKYPGMMPEKFIGYCMKQPWCPAEFVLDVVNKKKFPGAANSAWYALQDRGIDYRVVAAEHVDQNQTK